jgi:threonine dehydrogenase-like Zn-dependent dehydrogenase
MPTPDVRTTKAVEWTLEGVGRLNRSMMTLHSPTADEILVRSALGAVSPGLERTLLHGVCASVSAKSYPHQPGYLNVVSVVDAPDRTLIGDRGIAMLGHRDMALIPYKHFIRIPAGISDEVALLGVLASDANHAIRIASVESNEDCLVVGGGILGVLTAWELCLRTKGAIRIVERHTSRRKRIAKIAFPRPVTVSDEPGRYRFHTTFDCASTSSAFALTQTATRSKGSIVLIADGSQEPYALTPDFFRKGLYLGKAESAPELRSFLDEFFARGGDYTTLVAAAFEESIRFDEFPQAYLKLVLAPSGERTGLVPQVLYD